MDTSEQQLGESFRSVFHQIQNCGDIISSILLISKFVSENQLTVAFPVQQLRQIALRSVHGETSTCLWHINALIAASQDFEHLLLGIEMMFDRFLGSKQLFIQEKQDMMAAGPQTQHTQPARQQKQQQPKSIGDEIVSLVDAFCNLQQEPQPQPQPQQQQQQQQAVASSLPKTPVDVASTRTEDRSNDGRCPDQVAEVFANNNNNENENRNLSSSLNVQQQLRSPNVQTDEGDEYCNGKLSSPVSFRLKQQKRMIQAGRVAPKAIHFESDFSNKAQVISDAGSCEYYEEDDNQEVGDNRGSMQIASPFNVSKFAKTVDAMTNEELAHFAR